MAYDFDSFDSQFLSNRSCGFGRTFCLQPDDFNQVYNTGHVIPFILLACQAVDLDRDGGVWFFLEF